MKNRYSTLIKKTLQGLTMSKPINHNAMDKSKILKTTSIAMLALSLTACYQTVPTQMKAADLNQPEYMRNHPIVVKKGKQEIDLAIDQKSRGLSPNQIAYSAQFILDYMDKGEGKIEIWLPRGNLNAVAVKSAHQQIRGILNDAAILPNAINYNRYDAFGNSNAPIGLKFKRYYASTPQCGVVDSNLSTNYNNQTSSNFGCAHQSNIALMVSNPKDFIRPSTMGGASAERRQIVWAKYIKGIPTGATRSADETIAISGVAR